MLLESDGTVLVHNEPDNHTTGGTTDWWKFTPDSHGSWTLEPNGELLTVDAWAPAETQLYDPRTQSWSFAGSTAANGNPVDPFPVVEIGPQVEMPGGNTFVVGAGSSAQEAPTACTTDAKTQTALYQYQPGTAGRWAAGPQILGTNLKVSSSWSRSPWLPPPNRSRYMPPRSSSAVTSMNDALRGRSAL